MNTKLEHTRKKGAAKKQKNRAKKQIQLLDMADWM